MLPSKVVPIESSFSSVSSDQSICVHFAYSLEATFLIAVSFLSIMMWVNVSAGIAATKSLNSTLEATLTESSQVLDIYLAACTSLATIGFIELISHVFAKVSGIQQSPFEQRDRGAMMSTVSIVPVIAVVFASKGYLTALPFTFAFNNSILCCGHTYSLLKILASAYPTVFSKTKSQLLSIAVYLTMIGLMFGFGKDVKYWINAMSAAILILAFIFPSAYLLWQVVRTNDYLNKKSSSYSSEEGYTICLVCLFLTGLTPKSKSPLQGLYFCFHCEDD